MVKKEFGRYSAEDLGALVHQVKSIESDIAELKAEIAVQPDKVKEYLTPPFFWATFYQVPFLNLVVAQLKLLGLLPQFSALAKEADPHAAVLRELPGMEPEGEVKDAKMILGILMALRGNIESMGFYSKSMEELTRQVESGDDEAFFDAILIDRTILSCPPFADRMALAEYQNDEKFFQKIGKRLRQGSPTKRMKSYAPLRVCLYTLEKEGCLTSLSEKRAYELFCQELDLYPEEADGDTSRSLKRFIQRWQTERAT